MDNSSTDEIGKTLKASERHLRSIADCLRVLCALAVAALGMWYYSGHH